MPIVINGFFPGAGSENGSDTDTGKCKVELSMLLPIALFAIAALVLGIFPDSLIHLLERIAGGIV
jgi:hypothetical protein